METMIGIVKRQSEKLFRNIEFILDFSDDQLLQRPIASWPLWRQLYHLLHSLDQWFINPYAYVEPSVDAHAIKSLDTEIDSQPTSLESLYDYFKSIEHKIAEYLSELSSESLLEHPIGSPLSRLDLILGEFRHVMYHVGMIHGYILMESGEIPDYVGQGLPDPPTERQ